MANKFWAHGLHGNTSSSYDRDADSAKILKRGIVIIGPARRIRRAAFWHDDYHPLSCSREQNTVGIFQIGLAFGLPNLIPAVANKREVLPTGLAEAEVAVPDDARPIELKPLHVKLCRYVLQIIG